MRIENELFDSFLAMVLRGYNASQLLQIPGIYEILAEEFNNEVLKKIEEFKNFPREID